MTPAETIAEIYAMEKRIAELERLAGEDPIETKIVDRLVAAYRNNPARVAAAMDESIDQSGNLLGWVRDLSASKG